LADCSTCESIALANAPGGCIHRTEHWFVDRCVGPLGVGTLIIKPIRHVVHVSELKQESLQNSERCFSKRRRS
jgi:diadenosine tetraphosphate (Ap4A) HIT family hydrolase